MRQLIGRVAAFLVLAGPAAAVEQTNWRYDEDWSVLRDGNRNAAWWQRAKYVPLSQDGSAYASFGAEARARYEGFHDNLWGTSTAPDDGYLWLRSMPHADVHAGPMRAFVQLIAAKVRGAQGGPGPADSTGLDVLQSFADVRAPFCCEGSLTIRGGRSLMPLGSERLVGIRYGPNIPQAFDGGQAIAHYGPVRIDLFYVRPVMGGPGDFDDRTSNAKRLHGIYTTARLNTALSADVYWLAYGNNRARFDQGAGRERRNTFGLRIFGGSAGWAWNWEGMLQRGHFGPQHIQAWSLATETSYRFADIRFTPRLRLRANIASGDRDPTDNQLGTFNAMFPKGKYFGELSPIGPYNIVNVHPSVDFDLGGGVTVDIAGVTYWRASHRDGLYDVPGQLIRSGTGSSASYIGTQADVAAAWQVSTALSFGASLSLFTPGAFIRQTGRARTIHMIGAEAMYRF